MSEESKKPEKLQIPSPEIKKGNDAEIGAFDHARSIHEGYQPIRDILTTPPDGGSGVPDKEKD